MMTDPKRGPVEEAVSVIWEAARRAGDIGLHDALIAAAARLEAWAKERPGCGIDHAELDVRIASLTDAFEAEKRRRIAAEEAVVIRSGSIFGAFHTCGPGIDIPNTCLGCFGVALIKAMTLAAPPAEAVAWRTRVKTAAGWSTWVVWTNEAIGDDVKRFEASEDAQIEPLYAATPTEDVAKWLEDDYGVASNIVSDAIGPDGTDSDTVGQVDYNIRYGLAAAWRERKR